MDQVGLVRNGGHPGSREAHGVSLPTYFLSTPQQRSAQRAQGAAKLFPLQLARVLPPPRPPGCGMVRASTACRVRLRARQSSASVQARRKKPALLRISATGSPRNPHSALSTPL